MMERDPILDELLGQRLKSMKSTAGIDGYLHDLFKQAVAEMLKAEMDNHLGYEKHSL